MAKFNGHKNWNHWNVSLWINNDAGLYHLAMGYIARTATKDAAAVAIMNHLIKNGFTHTPDGASYSKSAVRAALVGM